MKSAFFKEFGIPGDDCEIEVRLDDFGVPRLFFRSMGNPLVGLDLTGASQLRNMLADAGDHVNAQEIERHIQEALRLEGTPPLQGGTLVSNPLSVPSQPVARNVNVSAGATLGSTVDLKARANIMAGGRAALDVTQTPPVELRAEPLEIGKVSARISFRDSPEGAERLTQALSTEIKERIVRLKNERRNDLERQAEIDFLENVSATLDQIAAAISEARRAATPQDRDQKYAKAETLAGSLAKACRNFAERNYERVIDYGGFSMLTILGTLFFTELFDLAAETALAAQLALLGLSGTKK